MGQQVSCCMGESAKPKETKQGGTTDKDPKKKKDPKQNPPKKEAEPKAKGAEELPRPREVEQK